MILTAVIGVSLGLLLSTITFFIPRMSMLIQIAAILGTQAGIISQPAFLLAMCIYGGLQWGISLIHTYFCSSKSWNTETATKLAIGIGDNAFMTALPITIGAIVMLLGGAASVYAGLSKYMVALSLPFILIFLIKKVIEMKGRERIAHVVTLGLATALAIGFLTTTGSPLAMAALIGFMSLGKPEEHTKHDPNQVIPQETYWSIPCTGNMWQALGLSTFLIGTPWSLVYEQEQEEQTDLYKEVRKGMMELLSDHFSTLLFLVLGMARTAGADAMSKAITISLNPIFVIGCIIVMLLLQLWVTHNLAGLIELFLTHKPKQNIQLDWWIAVGVSFATCVIIGLPLAQSLIFLGLGLLLNQVIDYFEVREFLNGIFSRVPLIGIAFL